MSNIIKCFTCSTIPVIFKLATVHFCPSPAFSATLPCWNVSKETLQTCDTTLQCSQQHD